MICISEPEAPKAATELEEENTPQAKGPVRPAFAPRQFLGQCPRSRGNHPRRLSHALRSIALQTDRPVCIPPSVQAPPVATDIAEQADETAPAVATTHKLRTPVAASPAGEDRRRFLRRFSTHLVRVLPVQDVSFTPQELDWALHHSPLRGQMKNISMNGVAFLLNKPLEISASVWLRLECRARDFAVIRSAHVTRAVPVSETEWIITCRFDRCVPYPDVTQLGQELC